VAQSATPADAGVNVGQVFQGKYRVDSILGHGGMGVVAECTHLALNERVAVKMLRQDVLHDQDAVQRFIREAQAAVKLKSEYVARVSDVGTFENGVPYMVMEFLEGHDLGELLSQRGVLPTQWAVELMLQTAEALAEAHSLGIVHRDVKPTNLFVTWRPDGTALIKVLDFGISKSPMGTDMNLTQTQSLLGTPAYMSPEQMRSARLVDTRTDIWSLGTVFYEILEGRRPFEAESFSEMCVKVAVDAPAPMVNTPPSLQQVILRCLAKAPEQRYATMAELGRDLVPYAADPHNAQVLVERMARMLRRSTYDWESATGTGSGPNRNGTGRELGSGPVPRAATPVPQQWSVGSDPQAQPWSAKSDPHAQPWAAKSDPYAQPLPSTPEGSTPFARPIDDDTSGAAGTTLSVRRSRWPLVLLLLGCLGAATAGYFVWSLRDGDHSSVDHQAVDDNAAPPKIETVAPAETPAVPAPTHAELPAPAPDEAPAPAPVVSAPAKKQAAAKTTKASKPKAKKLNAGSTNLIDPNEDAKPAAKPCNPFDSMHGCPSK